MHDVSIPAALIAGLVSFLSPCVLPLVPPYLIYLTGATIEHVANDETTQASKRAVMTSALMFVLGFSTVFVALGASALPDRRPDPRLVGGAFDPGRHRHHHHGPAFPRPDPDRPVDARGPDADAEAGRAVGRLCDGLAFAFGWTPCIGPILAAILSIAAAEATVDQRAPACSRSIPPGSESRSCWQPS